MAPDILPGERLDAVNDKIELIQKPDGLTFGTDALLLAGYIRGKYGEAAELGGGSGIISMLVATRKKAEKITVYEVQESYADLTSRNIRHNSLSDKVQSVCLDCREIPREMYGKCELVFTNPPYMRADSGYLNDADGKRAARHEMNGDISDFVLSAAKLLKYGADIIVGTGKNDLQKIEYRSNGDGEQALVIPSLGKVISLEESVDSFLGGIADITVSKDPKTNKTHVSSAKLIPTVTVYEEAYANVRVLPFSKCTEETIKKHGFVQEDESFTFSYIQNYYNQKFADILELNY